MVNCSYCGKEIDRLVFCKPSHKVMYHKKKTAKTPEVPKLIKKKDNVGFCSLDGCSEPVCG